MATADQILSLIRNHLNNDDKKQTQTKWICLRLFFPHDGSENASRRSSYYVEDVGFPTSGHKKRYVGT